PVVPAATPGEQPAPMPTEAKREETAREEPKVASPEPAPEAAEPEAAPAKEAEGGEAERLRKFSSPLVRNIAAKEGVNLEEIEGTGAQGRVTKDDIMKYLEQRKAAPAAAASPPPPPAPAAAAPSPPPPPAAAPAPAARAAGEFHVAAYQPGENVDIEPMSKIRQITAAHMVYSKATSAHVTTVFHVDMSRIARA